MDLTYALEIGAREVVALTGGGGKTTAMYCLCAEAAARNRRAVATGTARFTRPYGQTKAPLLVDDDPARLVADVGAALVNEEWLIAASGRGEKERLLPVSYETVGALALEPSLGLVAVEADGSAMRAFKAPADHEPAVPPSTTLVLAVTGADIFGKPLSAEFVHRHERVAALTGASPGEPVGPEIVATVLAHEEGGRKGTPPAARFAVLLNKVTAPRLQAARHTARLLIERGVPLVVLARVRERPPVVEVVPGL